MKMGSDHRQWVRAGSGRGQMLVVQSSAVKPLKLDFAL